MNRNKGQDISFPVGYFNFNEKQVFNYQLNRWYSLGFANFEDFKMIGKKIDSFEKWKAEMRKLAVKAISEDKVMNAAIYYRAAEFYTFEKFEKEYLYDKFSELFYKAIAEDKKEILEVPYESGYIPVIRLIPEKEKKGTILLHGGFDSFIEEFYYMMKYLRDYGFEVLGFEGPGQGKVLIKQGLALDYRWEKPVKTILDYFDIDNVSIFGISMGGWFCLRASAFEPRIKNVIATGHAIDYMKIPPAIARWLMIFFIKFFRDYTIKSFKKQVKKGGKKSWEIRNLMHITQNDNPVEAFEYAMNLNESNLYSELVKQNVFLMTAKNDHFIPFKMHKMQKRALTNVKSLTERVFTKDEQADNHCQIGNIQLMLDTVIDWLNEYMKLKNLYDIEKKTAEIALVKNGGNKWIKQSVKKDV